MKKIAIVLCASLLTLACSQSPKQLPPLQVQGTTLTAGGEAVTFRGVSYGWHNIWPRFYNEASAQRLVKEWNVPILRAAIGADDHAKADNPGIHGGYMGEPEFALDCLYKVMDGAIEAGAYIIVDWHSHVLHLEEAKEFFTQVATRYKDCNNVIYELYNEPVEDSWEELKAYAEELIQVITGISTVHPLILMGCPHWDQDIHLVAESPLIGFSNVMYTVHFYAATHGDYLRERTEAAVKKGIPVFISECGATEASGDGKIDPVSEEKWIQMCERLGISWVCWSLSDKNESSSMLLPRATATGPWPDDVIKDYGKLVKQLLKKYNKQ